MAPSNILNSINAKATKPNISVSTRMKKVLPPNCNCIKELARDKLHLRFFLRQLLYHLGPEALQEMVDGFQIPIPSIQSLFQAELLAHKLALNGVGDLPKDAAGLPIRAASVRNELIIVKDEDEENNKAKARKRSRKEPVSLKVPVFIETLDD